MEFKKFLKESGLTLESVKKDYLVAQISRNVSELGRKEVFMGKAKFGIFGGGKEVPQVALSHFFNNGDFRSGYYRDQTLMFRLGLMTPQQLFAQLYAHTDVEQEPVSGGRLMTGHFGTRLLNPDGTWKDLTKVKNSSTDISPTAAQMPRLVGLAYASKLYRENAKIFNFKNFSDQGNEIAFGTIGNASCAEGMFFESINAIGVMRCPAFISIWDDGYGISVPNDIQFTKSSVWHLLQGFKKESVEDSGFIIEQVNGWDYPQLVLTYKKLTKICRELHVPVILHVNELTQPGGHSTSGSHERYKSKERLEWEKDYDCNRKMREWMISSGAYTEAEIADLDAEAEKHAKNERNKAWSSYIDEIKSEKEYVFKLLNEAAPENFKSYISQEKAEIDKKLHLQRSDILKIMREFMRRTSNISTPERDKLIKWHQEERSKNHQRYSSWLFSSSLLSATVVPEIPAKYSPESKSVDGREVLQDFFQKILAKNPQTLAFGEDVGKIGDVNQAFAGLQEIFGETRVFDTGIRECTIIGQAIGLAMRGFRPIAEIQYLDYLMYALQIISDDLATLQYRSIGGQKAPVIIRTRGHRLEGVWHSGSPMGTIIHSVRGVYVCVPRNMVQAAGMYNTLLQGDEPAIVIECLNGYRKKETLPDNLDEFTVPLGKVETLKKGTDLTIVTYGSMCAIVMEAAEKLDELGISTEVIDVQCLLPFDINHDIVKSISKTNRVLFADEDVPGGATAYMMQKVLEEQNGYYHLDLKPKCIHSWAHRPAYSTDGDYFSKPNMDDVVEYAYKMFWEEDPQKYPALYW